VIDKRKRKGGKKGTGERGTETGRGGGGRREVERVLVAR